MFHHLFSQVKYSVKYDKGPKGVLSLNHICPEEPGAMCDLSVGSRVVGRFSCSAHKKGLNNDEPQISNDYEILYDHEILFIKYPLEIFHSARFAVFKKMCCAN